MDRLQIVAEQSMFYRKNYGRLVKVSIILSVFLLVLLGLIFYQFYTRPAVTYFITTSDGRLIEIKPKEKE